MSKREEYLGDILDTSAHVHAECVNVKGWTEGHGDGPNYSLWEDEWYTVTLDTVRRGLGLIRKAKPDGEGGTTVRYLSEGMRREILRGDRTNGDEGGWDDGYLCSAVVEIGIWGAVVYG